MVQHPKKDHWKEEIHKCKKDSVYLFRNYCYVKPAKEEIAKFHYKGSIIVVTKQDT